jgi:hypothetical protein
MTVTTPYAQYQALDARGIRRGAVFTLVRWARTPKAHCVLMPLPERANHA